MGPLSGIRVVELAAIGPVPYAAMLLADLGADVIRVDRPGGSSFLGLDGVTCRNRRSIGIDLRNAAGVEVLLDLVDRSDVLLEGFRPGVAERLGIGPEVCLGRNQRLVYGRMTGWGQEGPLRDRAGHDLNYIALSGALDAIGPQGGKPVPPLNLVGDFGGGALFLIMGTLAALIERQHSGMGQIVDAAMVDGAASLMTMFYEFKSLGVWEQERGANLLDGGAPFYDSYQTADQRWMAVAALEPQFFVELLDVLCVDAFAATDQYDRESWPALRALLTEAFLTRTVAEWTERFADRDACVWPVLSMDEAPSHPFNAARKVFTDVSGAPQPSPAPRFSRTQNAQPRPAPIPGTDTDSVLTGIGFDPNRIAELRSSGAVF